MLSPSLAERSMRSIAAVRGGSPLERGWGGRAMGLSRRGQSCWHGDVVVVGSGGPAGKLVGGTGTRGTALGGVGGYNSVVIPPAHPASKARGSPSLPGVNLPWCYPRVVGRAGVTGTLEGSWQTDNARGCVPSWQGRGSGHGQSAGTRSATFDGAGLLGLLHGHPAARP